ncbi:site-specific DNA-methyltransferase [candidate division WOR-3 bacterium]|nr:site-specific DNA-methyltransferase [candidate division WOR-3 bacterium]
MNLFYKLIIDDAEEALKDIESNSIGLVVTSPPYYQMRDVMQYKSYDEFLDKMERIFKDIYRVMRPGRVFALNVPDGYIDKGKDYDVGLDLYFIARNMCNFKDEEKIIWMKPTGMLSGASKRFGNFLKQPYPFIYKPNRIWEFVFILTKGNMNRISMGHKSSKFKEENIVVGDMKAYSSNVWHLGTSSQDNPWDYKLDDSDHTAMFPQMLSDLVIQFYSLKGDVVLDPFLGSGTTLESARTLERSCIGIEMRSELIPLIKTKCHWLQQGIGEKIEWIIERGGR